jgi:hypothetical protein
MSRVGDGAGSAEDTGLLCWRSLTIDRLSCCAGVADLREYRGKRRQPLAEFGHNWTQKRFLSARNLGFGQRQVSCNHQDLADSTEVGYFRVGGVKGLIQIILQVSFAQALQRNAFTKSLPTSSWVAFQDGCT